MNQTLRHIPAMHELQKLPQYLEIIEEFDIHNEYATEALSDIVDKVRKQILAGSWKKTLPGTPEFAEMLFSELIMYLKREKAKELKKVINATGTVLHTNLGRARLSKKAAAHVSEIASHYTNLEFDILSGERGSRHTLTEKLLQQLTGAEACMVVNNNAAAVYLVLKALAKEKEVIVSRGQLVEIGGSFRVSSIMEESGAVLKEIGTTNKTHARDYQLAITDNTAIVMKVHTSNFKVVGFTNEVSTKELAGICGDYPDIVLYEDLGSGAVNDFADFNIGNEPVVRKALEDGADLVSFSGDKLLGGPQAGIIAGKKELIDILKSHQLARVLRVDKMTIAALTATIKEHISGEAEPPVIRDILTCEEELLKKAERLNAALKEWSASLQSEVINLKSAIGGGTMPAVEIDSKGVSVRIDGMSADEVKMHLRLSDIPIIVRIHKESVLFDMRTIEEEEIPVIITALKNLPKAH